MNKACWTIFLLTLVAGTLISCRPFGGLRNVPAVPDPKNSLERLVLPPNAVTIDVVIVRVSYQNRDLLQSLWADVDEQELDWNVRNRLNRYGFRAGIIGASIPDSLSRLLSLKGKPLRQSVEEELDLAENDSNAAFLSKPYTLRPGIKSVVEIQNELIRTVPVITNDSGNLKAKSYDDARLSLTVAAEPIPDGSVRLDVTPLLQYGSQQYITKYQHGQLIRTTEQPTKVFDDLKCPIYLRPGQFFVLGALDSKYKRLGNYYFSRGDDDLEQKILVVRLLITQHDGQLYQFPSFEELAASKRDESRSDGSIPNDGFVSEDSANADIFDERSQVAPSESETTEPK